MRLHQIRGHACDCRRHLPLKDISLQALNCLVSIFTIKRGTVAIRRVQLRPAMLTTPHRLQIKHKFQPSNRHALCLHICKLVRHSIFLPLSTRHRINTMHQQARNQLAIKAVVAFEEANGAVVSLGSSATTTSTSILTPFSVVGRLMGMDDLLRQ